MTDASENSGDARVDALVAQIVRLRDSGHDVEAAEILARHPDVAESVKEFLQDQAFVEQVAASQSQASVDTDADRARRTAIKSERHDGGASRARGASAEVDPEPPIDASRPDPGTTFVVALPAEVLGGNRPFGRYRIEQQLGEGAMGAVYLAHDLQLERKVALKTPKVTSDNAERLGKRFRREAQSAATLHHRNICPVYDVGQTDGIDYLTMAYIEGKPLSAYVNPEKPLAQRQIALVIRKLALALQAAHDAGVVHRDLKPSNVIIDREGEPVVMDFGLAGRVEISGDSRLTKSGTILGTPAYMAPEQIEGARKLIGPRSDIYALGVVMFELLSGRLPFRGSPASVMGKVLVAKPPKLKDLRADIDPDLAKVCEAMMVKHPAKRIGSMKAVAEQLTAWIRSSRQAEQPSPPSSSVADPPSGQNVVTTGEEMAALPRQAASRWKIDSNEISDARKTNQIRPANGWFKLKAWFDSLPPRTRRLIIAAGASLPLLLLLGVTLVIKIKIDDDGNVTTEVTRVEADDTTSAESESADTESPPPETELVYGPWIDLFNGRGTSEWEHLGVFRVEGDELVADGRGAAKSKQIFQDFELEFEWKLEHGGNSGVYYRAYPGAAINVWPPIQSAEFALDGTASPRAEEDNGSLWNVLAPTAKPPISPDRFHLGKIVCQGSQVEHWIDGTRVLEYDTSAESFRQTLAASKNRWLKDEGPLPSGRIYLQSNVGEVRFRNIRIREVIRSGAPGVPITARDLRFVGSTKKPDGWHGWNTLQVNRDGDPVIVSEWGSEPKGLYRMSAQGELESIATGELFIDPEHFAETDEGYYVTNAGGKGTIVFVPKHSSDSPRLIGSAEIDDPYGLLIAPPGFDGPNVDPGNLIVFENAFGNKDRQGIKSVDRETGSVKTLCRQESFCGDYNSSGELFAIKHNRGQATSIVKIHASGAVESVLSHFPGTPGYTGSAGHLAIHPTTDTFYFSIDGTVYAYEASWEGPRLIIDNGFHVNDWSPDGKLLYLQKDRFQVWAIEHAYIQRVLLQDRSARTRPTIPTDATAFEGHSYKVFDDVLSWKDAQRRCESMGGHLVTISHSAENRFVLNLVKSKFPDPDSRDAVWLGATDEVNEGQWVWVDGRPVSYTHWFKPEGAGQQGGQPNNKNGIEHYMIMWFGNQRNGTTGEEWCDQPNVSTQHRCYFVCEWDSLPVATTSNPKPTAIAASPGAAKVNAGPAASADGSHEPSQPQRFLGVTNARRLDAINRAAGVERGGIETLWVNSDGLEIYWQQTDWNSWKQGHPSKGGIWYARRASHSAQWGEFRRVCPQGGMKPSVTDDGLYMICTKHANPTSHTIYEASRSSKAGSFSFPKPIVEIKPSDAVHEAAVSADGTWMAYAEGWHGQTKLFLSHRSSPTADWGRPRENRLNRDSKFDIGFNFPRITDNGLTLWFQFGRGWPFQYVASGVKPDLDRPYDDFKYLRLNGRPLLGASAVVLTEQRQIIYTAPTKDFDDAFWEVWIADLQNDPTPKTTRPSLAGKRFRIEFLSGNEGKDRVDWWGNYRFTSAGEIQRSDRTVGSWREVTGHRWAAGENGFELEFTSPSRRTSFATWITQDRIVGGDGAIISGRLID